MTKTHYFLEDLGSHFHFFVFCFVCLFVWFGWKTMDEHNSELSSAAAVVFL